MKVLLALDYSQSSLEAFESLFTICDPGPAAVHVLHVIDRSSQSDIGKQVEIQYAKRFIAASVKKLSNRFPNCQITGEQVIGPASKMILERATKTDCELIVMGAHLQTGISDLLLGSVSRKVLTHAHCGVRIVRPAEKSEPKDSYNVLIATNDSEESDYALERILATGWPRNTIFKFVTALRVMDTAEHAEEQKKLMESWLKCCVVRLNVNLRPEMVTSDILVGDPKQAIIEEATNWPADLIVLGARKRTDINKIIRGSVSEFIATKAPCSVEVLPLPGREVRFVQGGE